MGELAIYSEHATADYPTCHIPFILKWPGGKAGISDSGFHYSSICCRRWRSCSA